MTFRVRYEKLGGHVHCSLFSARHSMAMFVKCGDFVLRDHEFDTYRRACPGVEFKEKSS